MDKPEPSPIKAITRVSITDSVVDRIREMIESGAYEVGEKLPTEAKLCKMLSVSRTSVREATRVLQTLGYVTLVPGKGAFVADLKPSDGGEENWFDVENVQFYDFMEVRMAIETLAVRLSVERATPKQIRALEKIHAAFLEANFSVKHRDLSLDLNYQLDKPRLTLRAALSLTVAQLLAIVLPLGWAVMKTIWNRRKQRQEAATAAPERKGEANHGKEPSCQ